MIPCFFILSMGLASFFFLDLFFFHEFVGFETVVMDSLACFGC